MAVAVHTTQFEIRDVGLLWPVLEIAADELRAGGRRVLRVAGVCGPTRQAVAEAELAAELGYDIALVSTAGLDLEDDALVRHVADVGEVLPVMGFYLQPAIGGRRLGYSFWRSLADLECVVAVKLAPFDRYATLDAVRGVVDSDREATVSLYTGNDDHILTDLLTTSRLTRPDGRVVEKAVVGSLLGQNAVWTRVAVRLFDRAREARLGGSVDAELITAASELTDANAAVFDAAAGFEGCILGIHEVLRRQGLLEDVRLLDPGVSITAHQVSELDRVTAAYPHLTDDDFVRRHLKEWLDPDRAPVLST